MGNAGRRGNAPEGRKKRRELIRCDSGGFKAVHEQVTCLDVGIFCASRCVLPTCVCVAPQTMSARGEKCENDAANGRYDNNRSPARHSWLQKVIAGSNQSVDFVFATLAVTSPSDHRQLR